MNDLDGKYTGEAKPREKGVFSFAKNIFCQFIIFPVIMSALFLLLICFIGILKLGQISDIVTLVLLYAGGALCALLCAFIIRQFFRKVESKNLIVNFAVLFLSPVLTIIAASICFACAGYSAAAFFAVSFNPFLWLVGLLMALILPEYTASFLIVLVSTYAVSFFIFSKKLFVQAASEQATSKQTVRRRPLRPIFHVCVSVLCIIAITTVGALNYLDFEYAFLYAKYDSMYFPEEVDYDFYEKAPFVPWSDLPQLSAEPALRFDDVHNTPNIDGATAFYPMYAAFADNIYTGMRNVLEEYCNGQDAYPYVDYLIYENSGNNEPELRLIKNKLICSKTSRAFERLTEGSADMIFTFEPSEAQIQEAQSKGVRFRMTKIGYDAFCFFVHSKNPVSNVSDQEIVDVYAGKTVNWKCLGGRNKRIFAFTRPENSGSQTIMENAVMQGIPIDSRYEATMVRTMGQIIKVVDGYLNTPDAIGYTFMYYSKSMVKADSIKYLAINGIAPTEDSVRSGAYLYNVPFYAITREGDETPQTKQFLQWLQEEQGQELIEKTGYIGL